MLIIFISLYSLHNPYYKFKIIPTFKKMEKKKKNYKIYYLYS